MTTEELIEKSLFEINTNGEYTQYLISCEDSPLEEKDICGCWLLVFNSKSSLNTWLHIYETLIQVVNSNSELNKVVTFETIHKLDSFVLCQNRGFNEAYTTEHYAEFLEDGECEPSEEIIEHIDKLKNALDYTFNFQFKSDNQKAIIDDIIEEAFVKPNLDLKWTDEPFPWTLYLAPITEDNLTAWLE